MKSVLVDTSSLLAYCKTNYAELLFENLQMSTTNVCNEEVKRQKSATEDFFKERACEEYLRLLRSSKNPDIEYIEEYRPNVKNQGEATLEHVFRQNPSVIDYVLIFDFDSIESFEKLKHNIGGDAVNTRISLPNYGFELLRTKDRMTDGEYCKATYQMGVEEGWIQDHPQKLDDISPVDCPRFP